MTLRYFTHILFPIAALLMATSCSTVRLDDTRPGGNVLSDRERPGVCRAAGESCVSQGSMCCAGLACTGLGKSICTSGH